MAQRPKHPVNALTAVGVRNTRKPGRYADGNGLYLHVRDSGSKSWTLRITIHGARYDMGLGSVSIIPLADARETAARLRRIARAGGDPREDLKREKVNIPTFREAALKVHADRLPTWRNAKHGKQWMATIERYALPAFGDRRVNEVRSGDVLKVLGPIWIEKAETARRLRQRIAAVFDWARTAGHIEGENPCAGIERGLPKQPERVGRHHPAMAYDDVPNFVQETLPGLPIGPSPRLALEFLILTAGRTSEVLNADWGEIELSERLWTVPAERMKAGRPHRVPLSARACAILRDAATLSDRTGYIFPGSKPGCPLSNMALLMAHRRAKLDAVPHGYRSSFRDWAAERSSFPHEVAEAALAHVVDDKVVAAYRRTDFFEKRRQLMAAWADFATCARGSVVALAIPSRSRGQ